MQKSKAASQLFGDFMNEISVKYEQTKSARFSKESEHKRDKLISRTQQQLPSAVCGWASSYCGRWPARKDITKKPSDTHQMAFWLGMRESNSHK